MLFSVSFEIKLRDQIFIKGNTFLFFAKNIGKIQVKT